MSIDEAGREISLIEVRRLSRARTPRSAGGTPASTVNCWARRGQLIAAALLTLFTASDRRSVADEHADAPPHRFTVTELERFGVTLVTAGPGEVDLGVELPGEVRPNADRTAHVAPRFPGTVREARAAVGDRVRAGDVLAIIESDTLAPFPLKAPFDGVVVDKHVVPGETVDRSRAAFVIADLSTVWVEIAVYQKDVAAVRPGQRVRLNAGTAVGSAEGTIAYVSPILAQATRTATARVVLANADGRWRPGLFVTAQVLDTVSAPVVLPRTALQRIGDDTLVFVVDGDVFAPRVVQLGRVGATMAEITDGLAAGRRVAADGSYLVKAELGKDAGGGHED